MRLSIVIPSSGSKHDEKCLKELLKSIEEQDFPKEEYEIIIVREGNSEEAKAIGIQRATGEVIGLFCTDNLIIGSKVLEQLVKAAEHPEVVGAYTHRYYYDKGAPTLDRYFALLGANDPVCWWLGKADRRSYLSCPSPVPCISHVEHKSFPLHMPSIGDNGCFIKADLLKSVVKDPSLHYCIDACEDLRRAGHYTWAIIDTDGVAHRSGLSFKTWLLKRWKYVNNLYWARYKDRRWVMVKTPMDYCKVATFTCASLLVLPQVFVSLKGYCSVRDKAWFIHPIICYVLTLMYGASCFRSLFRH